MHEQQIDETPLSGTARIARDLIRFDTSNYGGGNARPERPAADYVAEHLRSLGLEPRIIESAPGRANVITRIAGMDRGLPALVLHGHLDVVPAAPEAWSVDPFGGVIRDGMLWGRGAVDMKDMDAMMLSAVAEILRAGKQPRRDVILVFFADEEDGGAFGSHYLVTEHPELFAGAGTAISEVGGYSVEVAGKRAYLIQTGEKSLDWIRLRARGTAAHGSRVWHDNAVTALAEAVAALGRHEWPVRLCGTTSELVASLASMLDERASDPEALVKRLGPGGGFVDAGLRNTANPTQLSAGYKHNVIPDLAEALVDVRSLPGDEAGALAEIARIVGPHIEVEVLRSDISLEAPFSSEIVDAMAASLRHQDPGAHVLPYLLPGGTDNKALSRLGISGYGFVPLQLPPDFDFPSMFHGVDERVPLQALDFGHRVLVDLLVGY